MDNKLYDMIFKRKSFHLFGNIKNSNRQKDKARIYLVQEYIKNK